MSSLPLASAKTLDAESVQMLQEPLGKTRPVQKNTKNKKTGNLYIYRDKVFVKEGPNC